ncbi:hypothetical protein TNCV_1166891 [Trichonephila clavipes]|uniref:Uncharacterized protein n=1 Tax=Trichonephila clavipes TaxID=2585209 RepID=A0A8X6T0G1_TRICX|nr:hypothetical protein TNCV_1166891 [Trichonephila clavipes]
MHTRCLKCGESHRTNDCPIKEKIQNRINCNKTGHMANWSQCEEFPKKNPEKVKRPGGYPGTPAANEETPSPKENNNAIRELRRFFLDYPFLLEMGATMTKND